MSGLYSVSVHTDSRHARYVVIDVETTGLEASNGHEIIELAALPVSIMPQEPMQGELFEPKVRLGEPFVELVNPGRPIPPEASAIHGITDDMVKCAPAMRSIIQGLLDFLDGAVLVMHNAAFDLSFIQFKLEALGLPLLENLVVDTLRLARRGRGYGGNSLGQLARDLGLEQSKAHRALGDTETTARLFLHFLDKHCERGEITLGQLGACTALELTPREVKGRAQARLESRG